MRKVMPEVLSSPPNTLSPRILRLIAELDEDWRRLDERIEVVSAEIETLSPMPPNIRSLGFTKGIDALPLRHPRSPILWDWASERRWLRGDGFT